MKHFFLEMFEKSRTGRRNEIRVTGIWHRRAVPVCAKCTLSTVGQSWVWPPEQRERENDTLPSKDWINGIACLSRLKERKHMINSVGIGWAKESGMLSLLSTQRCTREQLSHDKQHLWKAHSEHHLHWRRTLCLQQGVECSTQRKWAAATTTASTTTINAAITNTTSTNNNNVKSSKLEEKKIKGWCNSIYVKNS